MSLAKPKSAIFITKSSLTNTFLAAKSLWIHYGKNEKHYTLTQCKTTKYVRSLVCYFIIQQ